MATPTAMTAPVASAAEVMPAAKTAAAEVMTATTAMPTEVMTTSVVATAVASVPCFGDDRHGECRHHRQDEYPCALHCGSFCVVFSLGMSVIAATFAPSRR
jgi:hypothetical protein